MAPRADTPAATTRREVVSRRLPPAALALARLVGECLGERVWRAALAEVEREAVQGVASKDGETD